MSSAKELIFLRDLVHRSKNAESERAVLFGRYVTATGATVRACAKKYGVSKSTVHKDLTSRLKFADMQLYAKVKKVLELNKSQRHIRGGLATKRKYMAKK